MSKTASRFTLATAACLALIALGAPSALAAPTGVDFSVSPATPQSGLAVTLTGTATPAPLTTITSWEWDLDGNPATIERTGQSVTYPFPTAGSYQVTLRVTSTELLDNQATVTKEVTVTTRAPTAEFSFNPVSPSVNDMVLFANGSSDPDNDPLAYNWSFGDGSGASTARNPTHAYATPGTKTVRLRVDDGKGGADEVTHQVVVRDPSAATASFTVEPETPVVGQTVTLTSTSVPSSGQSITAQDWDLDSDGQYDDAHGKTATRVFNDQGVYRIALRVRQANGNAAVAEGTIRVGSLPVATPFDTIGSPPPATQPTQPTQPKSKRKRAKPSLLTPFPIVRLRGEVYAGRTVVSVLSVRAPRGTLARVRCKGLGCPKVTRRKRSKGKPLRFYTFERPMAAGARLEISVVAKRRVGKFVRFRMRAYKPPVRKDLCLLPGKRKPRSCHF